MIAARSSPRHSGTGAGSSGATSPSAASMARAAWAIDLAMLHDTSGVAAVTGTGSGSNRLPGRIP